MVEKSCMVIISRVKIWATALTVNEYCLEEAVDKFASKCFRKDSLVAESEDRIASRAVAAAFEIFSFMWLAGISST